MKQGNWRKKLEYFWMYYKIPFLAVLGVCVVIVYFGYAKITEKEYAFNAILLDIHTNAQEEMLEEEFADYAGIDTEEYDVLISTSLLFSDSSSGNYAMTSLARLYTQIGTEELDVCMMLENDFTEYAGADAFMDLREVLGVYNEGLDKIQEIGGYSDETSVAGILYNTKHVDTAKQFLEYLLEG